MTRRVLDEFAFTVLAGMTGPGEARAEVTRRLAERVDRPVLRTVRLLASETVTHAVIHGSIAPTATIDIDGDLTDQRVRVEVTNAGPALPPTTPCTNRGLMLVDALAGAWGAECSAGTTTVWFEVDRRRRSHVAWDG